jgi:prevent-host-death family protein
MFALLVIPTRNSFVEILEDEINMAQKLTVVATFHVEVAGHGPAGTDSLELT